MGSKSFKKVPKILKISSISKKTLKVSVLFSNGESRALDFGKILTQDWKVTKSDPEFILLDIKEFRKVKLVNGTLTWGNVKMNMTGPDGKKIKVPFDVGADVLYKLSVKDEQRSLSIGTMFKNARLAAKKTQEEVALLSGTSRTYITKVENDTQDIELMTLNRIVQAGLSKHLRISIE